MSRLSIILLGGFQVELDGTPLNAFGTDKNRALLAYLALESERAHRREALANLLWSEHTEPVARNSLRQALYQLRRVLAQRPELEPHLLITPNQVQFNLSSDHWIDVVAFKHLESCCLPHHPSSPCLEAGCLENLENAVNLYRGELLRGFTLPHCEEFTDWQIIQQEVYHRQALAALTLLAEHFEVNLEYEQLIACTQRTIELEPWLESAYRHQMWALAMTGQRERALLRYRDLQEILQHELAVAPSERIRCLYEQIRDDTLPGSRASQGEPSVSIFSTCPPPTSVAMPFAGRQSELAKMHHYLHIALGGQGQVAFVSGEAGSGKTSLLDEFARQAVWEYSDLLVLRGRCSAYHGLGDCFQPFREILESMLGMEPVPFAGAGFLPENIRRLKAARPLLLQSLFDSAPGLIGSLLPASDLLQLAQQTTRGNAALLARLEALAAPAEPGQHAATCTNSGMASQPAETPFWTHMGQYDQVTRLLMTISRRFPLLILLDDLQWLDSASASLLFHLGCHLAGERILLLGAYRSEDVASAPGLVRHPLVAVLHEFQRRYGEIQVDLTRSDGCAFVDACLDSQPNRFERDFRELLYRHTGGNPLYTVELLLAMQARGEVLCDETATWVQGAAIDWDALPARVEAIIAERLERLEPGCLALLKAASMQGEIFTAGILAWVLRVPEEEIVAHLSGPLCKQHLLVSSLVSAEGESNAQARYRFRCLLTQKYLYQCLDDVERKRLHWVIAEAQAIRKLVDGLPSEIPPDFDYIEIEVLQAQRKRLEDAYQARRHCMLQPNRIKSRVCPHYLSWQERLKIFP